MELPLGNFFEVTINSNKLLSSIQQLHDRIAQQDALIDQLSRASSHLEGSIWERLNKKLDEVKLEVQRRTRANQEELNHFKLILKDHDKTVQHRINEISGSMTSLRDKIDGVETSTKEDTALKLSYLQRKIQNSLTAQQHQQLLREQIERNNIKMQKITQKQAQDVKKLEDKIHNLAFLSTTEKNSHKQSQQDQQDLNPLSVTYSFLDRKKCKSLNKKRQKTQRFGAMCQQTSDVKLFMDKIQQIQKRLANEKENQNDKIDRSARENKGKEVSRQIMARLTKIAEQYAAKLPQFETKMMKISNRYDVIDQQIGILGRKFEKERSHIAEIASQIKRMDEKRIDDRAIENIRNSLKIIAKQFEEQIDCKVDKQTFEKQTDRMNEKTARLFSLIHEKCDKTEAKKGLTFLEDKVKDIIIVLAEERNLTKDSAIRRIQAKCLTCDKDLEPNPQENPQKTHKSMRSTVTPSLTGRSSTGQLRRRVRVMNGSTVAEDSQ